ncbi:Surface lipoprotein [uncultured Candidatus Thioglobus sp.]|nr:Surface lipoprotein [uncultured Candidatus Thioglobus sp.]
MQHKVLTIKYMFIIFGSLFLLLISGCASQKTKNQTTNNNDQLEPINRISFGLNETLDEYILHPIATGYAKYTPEIYKTAITNFFDNLETPNIITNSFLQGDFQNGFSSTSRFLVNSTIGIAGLLDPATCMGIKKHYTDVGQTLAKLGISRGSYLQVPISGANTVRNSPNIATSILLDPTTYLNSTVLLPLTTLKIINARSNILPATNIRDEAAIDLYNFTREVYLQKRIKFIEGVDEPMQRYEDIFDIAPDDSILSLE